MKKFLIISLYLLCSIHSFSQEEIQELKKYNISLRLPVNWIITQEIVSRMNNNLYFLRIRKKIDIPGEYLDVIIKIDTNGIDSFSTPAGGNRWFKIDTVYLSGYLVKRMFGENLGVIDETDSGKILDYSIEWLVKMKNNTLMIIAGNYFAEENSKRKEYLAELLNFASSLKIN